LTDNWTKDYVTTNNGNLVIKTDSASATWSSWNWETLSMDNYTLPYQSGMISSWNKFCFTGGVLEVSVKLPGSEINGGLWPALWLLGNLVRAPAASSFGLWPWSYNKCKLDMDESDNSHNSSGLTYQLISACNATPGFGLNPYQGRGAPEVDIFEVSSGLNYPPNTLGQRQHHTVNVKLNAVVFIISYF